jgi:pimeloyl-ACP methyl ester carboxylesterase
MSAPMPHLEGVEHRWVDLGGWRMHVAEAGAGDPVVLLHGWPQHWYCFRHLIPPLAARHRVLAPDMRGFGWSDAPRGGYGKEEMGEDVIALLDALGLERVKLVAHDWGGVSGFFMCVRHPEWVERYVALNTGHLWIEPDRALIANVWRLLWYQSLMATPLIGEEWIRRVVLPVIVREMRRLGAWDAVAAESFAGQFADRARRRATRELYTRFVGRELPSLLRGRWRAERLTVPTLFLHGASDPVIAPELVRRVYGDPGPLELRFAERTGHFIMEERPEMVLGAIEEFFAGGEPSPALSQGLGA